MQRPWPEFYRLPSGELAHDPAPRKPLGRSSKRLLYLGAPLLALGMVGLFWQSGYRAFTATFGLPLAAQLRTISDSINAEVPKAIDGTTTLLRTYVEGNVIVYRYALASPMPGNHRSYAQGQKQAHFSAACTLLGQLDETDARVAHQYVDSAGNYASWTLDAEECGAQHKG